jgi:tetratricopeptide (TPR) repeat protein
MSKLKYLALLPLLLVTATLRAQHGGDLQAQIVYAFQTEDNNRLEDLLQGLREQIKTEGSSASLRYDLAHTEYRLGLLYAQSHAHDPQAAFAGCIDDLKVALEQDVKSAEVLTLQAACYLELAKHRKLESVILHSLALDRLNAAVALAPRNPRAVYFAAMDALERAKPGSADQQRAFAQLQLAAQLFEQTSATRDDAPGWGHAEAYLALGREFESRHDLLNARNWIEQALIVAPDYKAAQRQHALLLSH